MIVQLIIALFLLASTAEATVTIRNNWPNAAGNHVIRFDIYGDALDAHDGMVFQDPNDPQWFYRYGTSQNCGRMWGHNDTPFCGFKSWKTKDFQKWYPNGLLFDPAGVDASKNTWQSICIGAYGAGCYEPNVLYNAASKKYVLWILSNSIPHFQVFTSDYPDRGFVVQTAASVGSEADCDFNLIRLSNGDAYIAYTSCSGHWDIYIQKLTSDYQNVTGSAHMIKDGTGDFPTSTTVYESPSLFEKGSKLHMLYGRICGFCQGSDSTLMSVDVSNPLGTWTQGATLNSNSCGGQVRGVARLNVNGSDVYLYWSDRWRGQDMSLVPPVSPGVFGWATQGRANFFEIPLTFSGDTPQPFNCDDTYTLDLLPDPTVTTPANLMASTLNDKFGGYCDVNGGNWEYQTFTTAQMGLHTLRIITSKGPADGTPCLTDGALTCPIPNQDLRIIVAEDNGGAPGNTVSQVDIPRSTIGYAFGHIDLPNIPLSPGKIYGYVMKPVANMTANSCYGWVYSDGANSYSNGNTYYTTNGGISWIPQTARDLAFQLIGPGAPAAQTIVRMGTQGARMGQGAIRWGKAN
jgi:hypothetical protein